ncbi:MAG: hypothetical protein LBK61_07210 [Spirochaetaceae bacterium]|nr:hypothetical protein [Spirochaetaceae bacterium]
MLKVVETGAAKEIDDAVRLDLCKKLQVRRLKEELFMAENVAVDILAFVLRGDTTQTSLMFQGPRRKHRKKRCI